MRHGYPRKLGQGTFETHIAVIVSPGPSGTAHIDNSTCAAHGFEQPFRPDIGVFFLIIRQDIGAGFGHRLINGDHDDPRIGRLFDRVIDAIGIGGINDDGIHARLNQVADILGLARRVSVAVRDVQRRDHARRQRLRLHRADHLLAPAITLHSVGNADGIAAMRFRHRHAAQTGQQRRDSGTPINALH